MLYSMAVDDSYPCNVGAVMLQAYCESQRVQRWRLYEQELEAKMQRVRLF
jgi:hypothetical protein